MLRYKNSIRLATLTGVLALSSAFACPLAYSVNFSGQFGIIDLATGVFTPIGPGLDNGPSGLAGVPGGPFYTVDSVTGHLLKLGIDGKVSDAGDTKTGPAIAPAGISVMGSLSDGTLYALDFSNHLFRINPATAELTSIGAIPGLPPQESDYSGNMTTSLAGTASQLIYTVEISDGPRMIGPTAFVIDPSNTESRVTGKLLNLPSRVIGSGRVNGVFYLFGEGGHIIKLNPATVETSLVARYDSGLADDTPPLTGIFGVVGSMEPNALPSSSAVETQTKKTRGAVHWPSRRR